MISQLHMAKSAMFAFQRKLQVITSNIANSQTVGYKRRATEMESLFPLILEGVLTESDQAVQGTQNSRRKYVEYGQGVRIAEIRKNMEKGSIEITNQPLDMAIDGQGFFQFRQPDGTLSYGRAGNFHTDAEGNVVGPNGHPLEPSLRIPNNTTEVIINEEGRVYVQVNNETTPREIGQILLANFTNPAGLVDVGQNLYRDSAASGEPRFETPGRDSMGYIRQRALEFSNVNVIEEMMNMVMTQRAFEVTVKAIQSGDSMLKTGSDIGK